LSNGNTFCATPLLFLNLLGKDSQRLSLAGSRDNRQKITNTDTDEHLRNIKLGDLISPEVLEDPERIIDLRHLHQVSYGTIGEGLGLEMVVWPQDEYALAVTRKGSLDVSRHRATVVECSAGCMNATKLHAAKLDFLLVDGPKEDWLEWLILGDNTNNPSVIVWMVPSQAIKAEKEGPFCSHRRKFM
jgi:hypothetical protein